MLRFDQPSFLLLGALLGLWIWFYSRGGATSRGMRVLVALLLGVGLAQLHWRPADTPVNLVILVDRSSSMPPDTLIRLREWLASSSLKPRRGDTVTLIGFANNARTEVQGGAAWPGFQEWKQTVAMERTNLGEALDTAASLLANQPGGRILLISDGLDQGGAVAPAVARLAAMGIPVNIRPLARSEAAEVSVMELLGPSRVRVGQPFIVTARIHATKRATVQYQLVRGSTLIAKGEWELRPGANLWRFRDLLAQPRAEEYRLEIQATQDAFPENNRGMALVRGVREKHAVVWTQRGEASGLARDLAALGFDVETRSASQSPGSAAELAGTRLAVLENVAATDLGLPGLEALRLYTERLGGALLITGGRSSFGVGGYHRSPLDSALPVSMEVRKEQRKAAIALCVVIDRSGSMDMEVSPGVKKIQLADEGTIAALQLLAPNDLISVIAVDSADHVVVPLQTLTELPKLASQIRRIESIGGGIFVYTGLAAALKQLESSPARTRHIILFADAADSEEQENVPELVARMKNMGITVSVIGLGTPQDRDAQFLMGVAAQSGGQAEFTDNARALPQLFAKETITILRSTFMEEPTDVTAGPDLSRLGPNPARSWPRPGGYNITYLRPKASLGLKAGDDQQSPLLAFWPRGRGRAAALTLPWEGEFSGDWPQWTSRTDFLGQLTTWLTASHESDRAQLQWDHATERPRLRLTLAERAGLLAPDPGRLIVIGPGGEMRPNVPFQQLGNKEWTLTPDLLQPGHYIAVLELNDREQVFSPPLSVAHAPEFDLQHYQTVKGGVTALENIMQRTGGTRPVRLAELLEQRPPSRESAAVAWPWWLAALLLYLFEIAAERFGWLLTFEQRLAEAWRRTMARRVRAPGPAAGPSLPVAGEEPVKETVTSKQEKAPVEHPSTAVVEQVSPLAEAKRKAKKRFG